MECAIGRNILDLEQNKVVLRVRHEDVVHLICSFDITHSPAYLWILQAIGRLLASDEAIYSSNENPRRAGPRILSGFMCGGHN